MQKRGQEKREGRVLSMSVPARKGECHTLCVAFSPIMWVQDISLGFQGWYWRRMYGLWPHLASSAHRRRSYSCDCQEESEILGHVSLMGRLGPSMLKVCPLVQYFTGRGPVSHLILLPASWNDERAKVQEGTQPPNISLLWSFLPCGSLARSLSQLKAGQLDQLSASIF